MRSKIAAMLVILLFVAAVPAGWSMCQNCPMKDWLNTKADSTSYGEKAGGMLLRGVYRVVTSPAELIFHTYDGVANHTQYGLGLLTGLGTGAVYTVDSIVRGAWDIVTSPIPDFHGAPDNAEDPLCKKPAA